MEHLKLKTHFRMKELLYTLIDRNEKVALYGIGGHYTDKVLHYEVDIIYIRKDKYGIREHIATNDTFGRDRSQAFTNKGEAIEYFNTLTKELMEERNLTHQKPNSIAVVEVNTEVVPEYQMVESQYLCDSYCIYE